MDDGAQKVERGDFSRSFGMYMSVGSPNLRARELFSFLGQNNVFSFSVILSGELFVR